MAHGRAPIVFPEKIRRPDPRGLVRDRLQRRLLDPDGPSVGLVLGPPGSGKTTLLTRVVAATDEPVRLVPRRAPRTTTRPLWSGTWPRPSARRWPSRGSARRRESGRVDALVTTLERLPDRARAGWSSTTCTRSPAAGPSGRWSASCSLRPRWVRLLLGSRRPPAAEHHPAAGLRRAVPAGLGGPAVPVLGGGGAVPGRLRPAAVAGGGGGPDPTDRRLGGRPAAVPPGHRGPQPAGTGAGGRRSSAAGPG